MSVPRSEWFLSCGTSHLDCRSHLDDIRSRLPEPLVSVRGLADGLFVYLVIWLDSSDATCAAPGVTRAPTVLILSILPSQIIVREARYQLTQTRTQSTK